MTLSEFTPASVQATIFTPGLSFSQAKVLSFVLSELGDRLDGSPISLPDADMLPPQIPRVIVQSSDGQYRLEAAPLRLNVYWSRTNETQHVSFEEFYGFAAKACSGYVAATSARVGRLASVLTRAARRPDPAGEISTRFCKAEYVQSVLQGSETFELHNHKKYRLRDRFNVNCWVRWKCGFEGPREKDQRLVIVEQDLNTLNEEIESLEFNDQEILEYFGIVQPEFDTVLALYLSEE